MMMLKLYASVLIAATSLLSCAGGNDKDYIDESLLSPTPASQVQKNILPDTVLPKTSTVPPGNQAVTAPLIPAVNNINLNPGNNPVTPAAANNTAPPITQAATSGNLNPAHGQPGHRCDINVGAPLNSKPAVKNTVPAATASTPQAPVNITAPAQPQQVAAGINPAHGQPGHRCDISVGAPLNSKPAPAVAAQPVNTPAAVAVPVKADSSKN